MVDHLADRRLRNARTETAVWPPAIVVTDPLSKNRTKVSLVERNHEVQTLTTDCADQALTKRVRLGNASWRPEYRQTHRLDCTIDAFRVNRVAIVNHESVPLIAGHDHPKLLRGPVRGRMVRHVEMPDSSRSDFQHDKHIDHAECGGDDDKEIAGESRSAVVPSSV